MHDPNTEKIAIKRKIITNPLLILYTGNGKGKTTAAMGLVFRAAGQGGSSAVIQFIKDEDLVTGERRMATRLGIPWENHGTGFLWDQERPLVAKEAAVAGWEQAKRWVRSHAYDLVVLDEFTYVLTNDFVSMEDVLRFFMELRQDPDRPHIVITGRNAPPKLVEICDMVHEIVEIKHPWRTSSIGAQPMIEY